jgi:RNA polymerase sigma-54 factor
MAPALDLRLRQHLALTPQLQQSLRLLQLSALEFAQEMGEALVNNPFLEETPENKAPLPAASATTTPTAEAAPTPSQTAEESEGDGEERYSYEGLSYGNGNGAEGDNERTDWGEPEPSLHGHLRSQLMLSQMGERDRALTHFIVDALDDDG